ncbi:MAG: tetratricopeptide repeat protein, partial [Deltaproteobacteria bacterium]
LTFLDGEAARAPTASARAALDEQRLLAATAAGDPGRALPSLLASERALPTDFEPPSRLAIAYRELGQLSESLSASNRALALAHGPRRVRLLRERAETHRLLGDPAHARADLEAALSFAATLPPALRPERDVELARRSLAAMH